jgi:alpha-tubulin suppressor-like RCC1 family protein
MATKFRFNLNNQLVDFDDFYVRKEPFLSKNLWVWGGNYFGSLGDNTTIHRSSPVQTVTGGTNWSVVACGAYHTAAIKTDGTLWTWGNNGSGQLGDNTITHRSSPIQTITLGTNWTSVSLGYYHSAALKNNGTLWTWGRNSEGQLGDNKLNFAPSPIQTIAAGNTWSTISIGNSFAAAIKNDGTLWLWGSNYSGQLGNNSIINTNSPVQTLSAGNNWSVISLSANHAAAIKTDGTLWLWGSNFQGQLGDNTVVNKSSPVQTFSGGTTWSKVACGTNSTAAIKTDGTLWTWGWNFVGQLGDNNFSSKSTPAQTVASGTTWSLISGGGIHYVATKTDGTLWVWGHGGFGQIGNNDTNNRNSPIQAIPGTTTWSKISCGTYYTTAIKNDGSLWVWGRNSYGQLGVNTTLNISSPVQTVSLGTNWNLVGCGYNHMTAIKSDGTLWTWGSNTNGILGDGTTTHRSSPIQTVSQNTTWSKVFVGSYASNNGATKTDGTLWMWGPNTDTVLGSGDLVSRSSPAQIGESNWQKISCGNYHTAAIKNDGTLWTWGSNNFGALGYNSTTISSKASPQQVTLGNYLWNQISCGQSYFTASINSEGNLWTWGNNLYGQLGDNTITHKSSPVQTFALGNTWNKISCGTSHTAAIKTDGTLWLWGRNNSGQLGDNTAIHKSSPIQTIAGGNNWQVVSCGGNHTVALKTDGTLWSWGFNALGQLGGLSVINRSSPIQSIMFGNNWKTITCGVYTTAAITYNDK